MAKKLRSLESLLSSKGNPQTQHLDLTDLAKSMEAEASPQLPGRETSGREELGD